jgi:rod shape-determining protein MreC
VSRQRTKFLTYLGLGALAFLFLVARLPFVTSMKFAAVDALSLPMKVITFPFLEIKKMLYYHASFEQNRRMLKEVGMLRARLTAMNEIDRENKRLEKLLNFKEKSYSGVAANVIVRDLSNWNSAIIIDKGKRSGIGVGMPVVDASGIVGKVVEVTSDRAKVILISDPSFSVAAMVERSREVGLVSGTLTGQCRMRYLSTGADVKVGDEVISSKLSSSFPQGLILGKVVSVENSPGSPFPTCLIKPAAALSRIEEVIVIRSSTNIDRD